MGVVYEAQHVLIGRKVALKALSEHAAVSAACVARFHREAQAAAAVGNPHIVDVIDTGHLDSGASFIVLEYLEGVALSFAVAAEGRFSVPRAVHVVTQLCDALSAVHGAHIVHRDLKPDNLFLIERDGTPDFVKVLDFGVCKVRETGTTKLTGTGDTVGTPQYMAPEQLEGRSDVDHRADIYALGGILYFVLTGNPPFTATTLPRLLLQICRDPPPNLQDQLPHTDARLDAVIRRALSKDPNQRFESCEALKCALLPFTESVDVLAPTLADRPSFGWADRVPSSGRALAGTRSLVRALGLERWGRPKAGLVLASALSAAGASLGYYLPLTPSKPPQLILHTEPALAARSLGAPVSTPKPPVVLPAQAPQVEPDAHATTPTNRKGPSHSTAKRKGSVDSGVSSKTETPSSQTPEPLAPQEPPKPPETPLTSSSKPEPSGSFVPPQRELKNVF